MNPNAITQLPGNEEQEPFIIKDYVLKVKRDRIQEIGVSYRSFVCREDPDPEAIQFDWWARG